MSDRRPPVVVRSPRGPENTRKRRYDACGTWALCRAAKAFPEVQGRPDDLDNRFAGKGVCLETLRQMNVHSSSVKPSETREEFT